MLLETLHTHIDQAASYFGTSPRNLLLLTALVASSTLAFGLIYPRKRKGRKIPGPKGYPVIGSMVDLARFSASGKQHEYFKLLHEEHGETVLVNVVGVNLVLTHDPNLIHTALTDTAKFFRDDFFTKATVGIADNALFVMPSGDLWKRHRKYLQPAFAPPQLRYAARVSTEEINGLMDYWAAKLAGAGEPLEIELYSEFTNLTLDIIGRVAFSYNFAAVENHHAGNDTEGHLILEDVAIMIQQRLAYLPFMWSWAGISNGSPRVKKYRAYIAGIFGDILAAKKEANKVAGHQDLLDRLLSVDLEDKQKFSDEEIMGEIMAFFFAGHETTANSLTFIAMELSRNPAVQSKLKLEILTLLSKFSTSSPLTMEQLNEFKFLDQVIKETQRRHAVVGILARNSVSEYEHDGFLFPANTPFLLHVRGVHMDPKLWHNPEEWNPDRWNEPIAPNAFIPFGEGPMNCIGQKMAVIEMKVVIIQILSKFSMRFVEEQQLDFVTATTYGLNKGMRVKLSLD
ncbi:Thromboxane-A synthase [Podochytrium sp. JEL0797]|nr:Thromboxane-A synthase [Podochytrium sp. JEL0797]